MERRSFIQNLAWLAGGVMASSFIPAKTLLGVDRKLKGKVTVHGKGLANVVISDGYTVLKTNKKGKFEFDAHPEAVAVFISTPSGFAFIQEKGIARHYRPLTEINDGGNLNFELSPLLKNDDEHQFIIWADPQVKNAKDVEKMMKESVPDVQKLVASMEPGTLVHGITVGDLVWDELQLFSDYDKAVEKMGIPFFQCLGNHDMDYRKGGDETSDDTFQKTYGPTYYSFNRGQVHYIVMDNVRYLGKERDYDGWFQQHQLDWLKKDLAFVGTDKMIVLCVHIPVHLATKNKEALYEIVAGRDVHIMSGHTHWHENNLRENIYEHNHGTVCGAWWTGPICGDGTPSGYGVYKVKGKELSWHYQATGKPADYQMELYATHEAETNQKQLTANIWNFDPAWKTEYFVDGVSRGVLEQFEGFDPKAYATMLGPDLPKPRGFAEPKKVNHLFKAAIPSSAKEVKVVATDRFGKKFEDVLNLSV